MVANPALIPLTVVTVRRVLVTPSGMMRFGGNAIAIEGSLLASVMTTPPAGAAAPKVIGKLTVSPGANVTFPGKSIPPAAGCVTATGCTPILRDDIMRQPGRSGAPRSPQSVR